MDLRDIAERTHLPDRILRYVLDQEIVPPSNVAIRGHESGKPRYFDAQKGVEIACAGHLLEAGVKRAAAATIIESMGLIEWKIGRRRSIVWHDLLDGEAPVQLLLGDSRFVRLAAGPPENWDSGWLDTATANSTDKAPFLKVIIQVDLGQIRDSLRGRDRSRSD